MSLERALSRIQEDPFLVPYGKVTQVRADSVRAQVPRAKVGSLCLVEAGKRTVPVEIVSLDPAGHVAMPLDDLRGVELGARVRLDSEEAGIPVGQSLLGKVVDSLGVSYETGKPVRSIQRSSLYGTPVNPLQRAVIREPLDLGIRSINACLTCGKGQRQGIFAGSGVGKSVLLGMMARFTAADVVVIGLIGERGREVREFLENELGEEGRRKSVVVVETSDKSAVRRARGAFAACAIAEYFREQGAHVLLLVDSLTRFAMAGREIGVAAGEPPTAKGYTPSVFSSLARVVERAGSWGDGGSITGLYTVLVEGDDLEDPVADSCRAFLDGHIVLSRRLANRGIYPPVDVLGSVSRVMSQVVEPDQMKAMLELKESVSRYQENEDAIHYGMYVRGTDPRLDEAIERAPHVEKFLRQSRDESISFADAKEQLTGLISLK